MSESPKMGLFGSKDETKATKKEESPDRYAPYCIDSDSETYDTEALSMMDINDIIGVQSEPVSDSTLESEIAALSQMITESKTDGTQNPVETQSEMKMENTSTYEETTVASEVMEKVSCNEETTSNDAKHADRGNSEFSDKNILQEGLQLYKQQKDVNIRDNCEFSALTECIPVTEAKDIQHSNVSSEIDPEVAQVVDASVSVTSKAVKCEENNCTSNTNEQDNSNMEATTATSKVVITEHESSIRGSLQLIGEAYSSEDSQESTANNEGPQLTDLVTSANESNLMLTGEGNYANDLCKYQQEVSNVSEKTVNISSDKSCTDNDIVNETIGTENVCTTKIDSSYYSVIPKHTEELPAKPEDTTNVANQCNKNDPSNIVSKCKQKNINMAATEISNIEEQNIGVTIVDKTIIVEQIEIKANKSDDKTVRNTCGAQNKESEAEITQELIEATNNQEAMEDANEKKETSQEDDKIINALEVESNITAKDETPSVKINNNASADTEVVRKESELQMQPVQLQIESGSIDNLTTIASNNANLSQVADNTEVSKEKADKGQVLYVPGEMTSKKLDTIETELEEEYTGTLSSVLSSETNNESSVVSEEDSALPLEEPMDAEIPGPQMDIQVEEQMEEGKLTVEDAMEEDKVTVEDAMEEEKLTVEDAMEEEKLMVEKEMEVTIEDQEQIKTANGEQIVNKDIPEKEVENNSAAEKQVKEGISLEDQIQVEVTDVKEKICRGITQDEQTEIVTVAKKLEEENIVEEEMEEHKKGEFIKIIEEQQQASEVKSGTNDLENGKNFCQTTAEGSPPVPSEGNILHNEMRVKIEETTDHANNKVLKNDLLLPSEGMAVSEKDAKEEHMELNLCLESEESESQLEVSKQYTEKGKENEEDAQPSEEFVKQKQEDSAPKTDNLLEMEESSTAEMEVEDPVQADDIEVSQISKNVGLPDTQENSDTESGISKGNLKDTPKTTNDLEEMFPSEQCQNTQKTITSILDDIGTTSDYNNILNTATNVINDVENVLQQSRNSPLAESEMDELAEKLPHESEHILEENSEKLVDTNLSEEQSSHTFGVTRATDITQAISSCSADTNIMPLEDTSRRKSALEAEDDKEKFTVSNSTLKVHETIISESINKEDNDGNLQRDLEGSPNVPANELVMDFEETSLEPVSDLREAETKLELTSDILLQNVDESENFNDASPGVETSQQSSEIFELESAVKFLQEPEDRSMDSPLALSPKVVDNVPGDIPKKIATSPFFDRDEGICENTVEMETELQKIAADSISVSETANGSKDKFMINDDHDDINKNIVADESISIENYESTFCNPSTQKVEIQQAISLEQPILSTSILDKHLKGRSTLEIHKLEKGGKTIAIAEENFPEQSKENILHEEVHARIDETIDHASEKGFKIDLLLPSEGIIVSGECVKDGHIENETNLTSDSEIFKPQSELVKSDVEERTDKQEDLVIKTDDLLMVEETSTADMEVGDLVQLDDIKEQESSENVELLGKEQQDNSDSKSDTFTDNLKDTPANNIEEMFSNEQCQSAQNIVTSILSDVRNAGDFKNTLNTETSEIENVLQPFKDLPVAESEMTILTEKVAQDSEDILSKEMAETISNQNMDSLEGLLSLEIMQEENDTPLKGTQIDEQLQKSEQQSSGTTDATQSTEYVEHVIGSSLSDSRETSNTIEAEDGIEKVTISNSSLIVQENIISESDNKEDNDRNLQKDLEEGTNVPENDLVMDFEETSLEPDSKLELTSDILLQNVDQAENLNDAPSGVETSQHSSEISELESAVKFLQESEEQAMDLQEMLSPKIGDNVVDDISKQASTSSLFVPDEDICENTSELEVELQNIATDSISISEAEIISEAAKLEKERKLAEQIKADASKNKLKINDDHDDIKKDTMKDESISIASSEGKHNEKSVQKAERQQAINLEREIIPKVIAPSSQNVLKTSESIPKVSILEERLKEPPKIEIPSTDITKVSMSPTTSKDSLLIQKDAKLIAYQKMLESPKLSDKSEPRIVETPRKDSEKHDFENVGSPRIILKIAKSAITDCGEPRSPKSPKIRSATNSPNPEDSPGQKLGKIKLKLSKGGHPSIISNENIEDVGQWHSEGSSSLSPIGMKIKLSKSGDVSIVSSEKYDAADDLKEIKHKHEESKRTESPIGMKIKLSKSGDASIVQQDCKELQMKHKDKLDMIQGSPKRTESPIGMKIKLSKTGDASIIQPERQDLEEYKDSAQIKSKDKHESCYDSPKRTESPLGMKIKLSKTGDASIVSPDLPDDNKESGKAKDKFDSSPEIPKRTESPVGMKIKLAKTKGGASIISVENSEDVKDKLEIPDIPKRTESPLGMKIKLSKTGDASIVHSEVTDETKEKVEALQDATKISEPPCGMKIKGIRSGDMQTVTQDSLEESIENMQESVPKVESPLGMKIKFSKFGDASIVPSERQEQTAEDSKLHSEVPKRTESPLGMKIKLSKSGDASIIQPDTSDDSNKGIRTSEAEHSKSTDAALGMKIKLLKTGDASIVDPEKKDRQQRRRDESPLEMKIRLSKTGHPTIVACDNQTDSGYKSKEVADSSQNFVQRYKEPAQVSHKEPALKILKTGHSTILQSNRSELTIEPVQMQGKKPDNVVDISPKRKDVTISPVESKKSKLEAQFTQILPEVTIQPVASREQKQFLFDPKSNSISLQQMNVINQEISITQVRPQKPIDPSMSEKLKDILSKNVSGSPLHPDCEIIEHRPELIIVNENSNSSQDIMIIEEVSANRMPEVKVPKKRGRPRRNPLPQGIPHPPTHMLMPRDPLSLEDSQAMQQPQLPHFPEVRENERPKRTCRSQKSYAPPKRGRGRGRGKRKMDSIDPQLAKKPRIEQDLNAIESSTTGIITLQESTMQQETFGKSPELYKALKQPTMDSKIANSMGKVTKRIMGQKNDTGKNALIINNTITDLAGTQTEMSKTSDMRLPKPISNDSKDSMKDKKLAELGSERAQKIAVKDDKGLDNSKAENRDMLVPPGHPNWLTPISKRVAESSAKHENVSTVQVIDEETRMSAESGSRSQTPARNISAPASETIVNEESQGSVLSTATTESEKVKVKNRRMEINFDPDEGPFTVDKIAEYEWPLDRKGETFMIQEQISQYLGVKSFKRKYPDLKRRVVDMEERNYLRENGLVSEAMCDMGLTAVCSSEVLDVMCSDFPDQYEEYRKHMREKQVKEHSKKQKELTAAANAEKNRIDLAEMAVQSALSWNVSLNKARRESRKCSLDLQTFTIHVPKKQQKVETERRIGHYPVALIPGQYTDYYREYTPAELRYYPLNTVLYGPMRPNERKFDSQSEGSQSDSDSDSSSDDSSSSSSEGTQDTEGSQSTMDDVDMEIANQKDDIKLKCKMCLKALNKHSKNEVLIQCGTCNGHVHPSCIDLTLDMVPHIQSYAWQCTDCKTCAQCHDPADEDKMLFCDMCDRGYHIYCVGLRRVPQGRWHCQECAVCANCGSREPGGMNSDRNSVAQWQHEYKKGDKNTRVYVSTLCVPCSKLWRKGRYCPHCSRCHTATRLDLEANLVHCSACDKYLHLGCVETKGVLFDRKSYLCDFCAPNRQHTHVVKPLISKTFK